MLHLDEGELVEYRGTYTQYRTARAADEERRSKLASRQDAEIQRLSTLADSMRGQTAKRARLAKVLDHRVERLTTQKVAAVRKERKLSVRLPDPPRPGATVLEVEGLSKSFGRNTVFDDVSFTVGRGERLLILGLNGAGKTTLLRLLVGQLAADAGEHDLGHGVSMGYYAQEHELLIAGRSMLDHMRDAAAALGLTDQQVRALLGMFGLSGEMAFQDVATLSGGEKTKLALAMLVAGRHNLLMLDEPTNNLDPPSRLAVGAALREWKGAMVFVSHDTEFVAELAPQRAAHARRNPRLLVGRPARPRRPGLRRPEGPQEKIWVMRDISDARHRVPRRARRRYRGVRTCVQVSVVSGVVSGVDMVVGGARFSRRARWRWRS